MKYLKYLVILISGLLILAQCGQKKKEEVSEKTSDTLSATTNGVDLPKPYATKSTTKYCKVIGWPEGKTPVAPEGFNVTKFTDGLRNPRWIYVADNGDIFVSEANTESKGVKKVKDEVSGRDDSQNLGKSANRISIFRDADKDGKPEVKEVFLSGLNQPFGMLILNNKFYVANTDGLWQFPYSEGQTSIKEKGKKILDLPAGGYNNHWTRNIISNKDGSKIFVSVGSSGNAGENGMEYEVRRANILEVDPDGSKERVYASGLRNPVGIDLVPGTNTLWAAVNERDELGDNLVPDYITEVKEGGFYGWPYSYFGDNDDPSVELKKPDSLGKAIVPDVPLDPHSASLGLAFYDSKSFPEKYHNGAFIGQHGSWNRSDFTGYKVAFVPFVNGKPSGEEEDFLTGFIADKEKGEVYGRPVGVEVLQDGSLLVADDASNTLWRVSSK